ncbi:DNA mismatch repair protein MutS [Flavobacteriaceae bacterium 3-367]|uniref:MutS-related protein n=1 Tax=Eudoraea algarum TaxID=3417568 RepID=UPI00328EFDB1
MEELKSFYNRQIQSHQEEWSRVKRQLYGSSMLRLAIFLAAVFGLYLLYGNAKGTLAVLLLTLVLFIFLVSRHTDLQYKRDKLAKLIHINQKEIKVLHRNFHHLPDGIGFQDPSHAYSQDIDLFGKGSFYQYCNRTALGEGSQLLAQMLTANTIDHIPEKQEAIKELAGMPQWRQDFLATAVLAKVETPTTSIVKWIKDYRPFMPRMMRWLPTLFSLGSLAVVSLYFLDVVPESVLIYWGVAGFIITGIYSKKISRLTAHTSKIQSTFLQYKKLLRLVEDTEFKASRLQEEKENVMSQGKETSAVLHEFSRLLGGLDQNNNIFYLVLGNGFFLRSLYHCYRIEQWIDRYGANVEKWFHTMAFFDAYGSLGNFGFNHPDYTYPNIRTTNTVLKAEKATHPLLDPSKSVASDFEIQAEQFFIVTGANMAGKSTFLRTVSLQIVMANMGLPVCAKALEYSPIKLITSMRTSDSLTDDTSYFFSELKRLKYIVDNIKEDRYFIVLDEILKGTNSTDKAIGSRKFVEKLVASRSTGIIATHDLSLCEVAEKMPQVENYYFDAEIKDNELYFDYTLKKGICKNMNASFLLKKMEIVE